MATKKKAATKKANDAAPKASTRGKKVLHGEGEGNKSEPGGKTYTEGQQAWERGESVPCAKNE